jgi:hypothetical protein
MATRLSVQLGQIFANLQLAQRGQTPSDLPSYNWQGDHLSLFAIESQVPAVEKGPAPAKQHAVAASKKHD